MSSATVQVLRTVPTSPMNSYVNQAASPFVPRDAVTSAMHLTEHLEVQQLTGVPQPGGTCTYELPYEVDAVKGVNLVIRTASAALGLGTAVAGTFALCDYFGLAAIDEISIKFGTERIQIVRPLELFHKLHFNLDNDKRHTIRNLVGGGLTLAQRNARIVSGEQQFVIPLLTLMGLHMGADLSQTLFVRAMTERWRITIKFSAVDTLYDADGGTFAVPAGGALAAIPAASTVFTECYLLVEGVHVADSERQVQEQIYMSPRRMLIRDHQYCTPIRVSNTVSLTSGATIDISMREINQPVVAIYVFLRWANDLDRRTGGAGGSRGCNRFNTNGWFVPGGTLTTAANAPIITHLEGRVGSNAFWLKKTRIQHLLDYERARVYKGSGVQAAATGNIPAPAIPTISFSHDPTRENASLGFVDFSQSDNPVLRIYFGHQGVSSAATIGAASTTDIGSASDLEVLVVADTITQLNFARGAALRLAN